MRCVANQGNWNACITLDILILCDRKGSQNKTNRIFTPQAYQVIPRVYEVTSIARDHNYFAHVDFFMSKKIVVDDKHVAISMQPKGAPVWADFPYILLKFQS